MIEKFSDEELRIIEEELAERDRKFPMFKVEIRDYLKSKLQDVLEDLESKTPSKCKETIDCIIGIADMSFKNYSGGVKRRQSSWLPSLHRCEYVEMCNEIVEIIKKHNRKWEDDTNRREEE